MTLMVDLGTPNRLGRKGQTITQLSAFLGYEWFISDAESAALRSSRAVTREYVQSQLLGSVLEHAELTRSGDLELVFSSGARFRTGAVEENPSEPYEPDWFMKNEHESSGTVYLEAEGLHSG
ncbi:hypothetical protein Poly30_02600 [Planctomycetes bacterium Poly30]|uniref:Uncharacterized protein n=2 Tax=Saltatorellus ferox TaxID=2528018 RepID=A0A518EKZ7_9BACT|nr:hypothetical protein Poly30_02600 [Planctomycetes bacterium Poly30]